MGALRHSFHFCSAWPWQSHRPSEPPQLSESGCLCAGVAVAVKAILLAAVLPLMSLSCCVCRSVGQRARCQYCAQFPGMSKSPGLVALIPAPTSTPWHGERSLAAFPCHVCVGRAACLQLGDRDGHGEVLWPRSIMQPCSTMWALHAHSALGGWDHTDRATAHFSRHEGSAGCHEGVAGCQGMTQPGWHAVLAGLCACCDSLVP